MTGGLSIISKKKKGFLRITIDHVLKFDKLVICLCKKTSLKLKVKKRIIPSMDVNLFGMGLFGAAVRLLS